MPCVSSTDIRTTNLADVNWTVTVMNQRRVPQTLFLHRILLRQRTIVDAKHSGEWTQRFQTANVTFMVTKGHS